MQTPYGEFYDEDIAALEFQLQWYMKYGNLPTTVRRESNIAKMDYGIQYERYIGHIYETHGFRVTYQGIYAGLQDGGIDLIARAPRKIRLVQCKRWIQPISTDVLSRLQGAKERFIWEFNRNKSTQNRMNICAVLATSGPVTEDAKQMACHLGIAILENLHYAPYPAVKAKRILPDAGKFLLPFTPGYDRLSLNLSKGDCFFSTVRDAAANGFFYPAYYAKNIAEMNRQKMKNKSVDKM